MNKTDHAPVVLLLKAAFIAEPYLQDAEIVKWVGFRFGTDDVTGIALYTSNRMTFRELAPREVSRLLADALQSGVQYSVETFEDGITITFFIEEPPEVRK